MVNVSPVKRNNLSDVHNIGGMILSRLCGTSRNSSGFLPDQAPPSWPLSWVVHGQHELRVSGSGRKEDVADAARCGVSEREKGVFFVVLLLPRWRAATFHQTFPRSLRDDCCPHDCWEWLRESWWVWWLTVGSHSQLRSCPRPVHIERRVTCYPSRIPPKANMRGDSLFSMDPYNDSDDDMDNVTQHSNNKADARKVRNSWVSHCLSVYLHMYV